MYMGEVIEAAPMPSPPMMRKIMNCVNVLGNAVPTAEIRNSRAETINMPLRPKRSLRTPPIAAPSAQPNKAQAAAQPFHNWGSRSKCFSRKPMAPEMTAVS